MIESYTQASRATAGRISRKANLRERKGRWIKKNERILMHLSSPNFPLYTKYGVCGMGHTCSQLRSAALLTGNH